eukprot:EC124202.1.p1 GENE.EC124202.1~~EC124202.1.p1  ORF type:complete len:100 (+),score=10.51 EC124202.1:303-602(+)
MADVRVSTLLLAAAVLLCLSAAVSAHGNLDQSAQIKARFKITRSSISVTGAGITSDQLRVNGNKCAAYGLGRKKRGERREEQSAVHERVYCKGYTKYSI